MVLHLPAHHLAGDAQHIGRILDIFHPRQLATTLLAQPCDGASNSAANAQLRVWRSLRVTVTRAETVSAAITYSHSARQNAKRRLSGRCDVAKKPPWPASFTSTRASSQRLDRSARGGANGKRSTPSMAARAASFGSGSVPTPCMVRKQRAMS